MLRKKCSGISETIKSRRHVSEEQFAWEEIESMSDVRQRMKQNSTFDWAGWDDTLCCSSIAPWYNASLI